LDVKLCEDVVQTVNVFYISIIRPFELSLQADSKKVNFVSGQCIDIGHISLAVSLKVTEWP